MKKIYFAIAACAMFAFAACSGNSGTSEADTTKTDSTVAAPADTTAADTSAAAADTTKAAEEKK
jgi:ABC-type enterochelin transport system substrate-binding protein